LKTNLSASYYRFSLPVVQPFTRQEVTTLCDYRKKSIFETSTLSFGGENAEAYFSPTGGSSFFSRRAKVEAATKSTQ